MANDSEMHGFLLFSGYLALSGPPFSCLVYKHNHNEQICPESQQQ